MRIEIIREDVTYLVEDAEEAEFAHEVIGDVVVRGRPEPNPYDFPEGITLTPAIA